MYWYCRHLDFKSQSQIKIKSTITKIVSNLFFHLNSFKLTNQLINYTLTALLHKRPIYPSNLLHLICDVLPFPHHVVTEKVFRI